MGILEAIELYWDKGLLALILASGIIQISPIKFNPLSWLARKVGNALNKETLEEVKAIDRKLQAHIDSDAEFHAINSRTRILRFADELAHGCRPSEESFKNILEDITRYNNYCTSHPAFPNECTIQSSKLIKDIHIERMKNGF